VTPGEAILTVQSALAAHGLPGNVGLMEQTRMFIIALGTNGGREAAPAVAGLLAAMGLEPGEADKLGLLRARCPSRLRPAPVPVVRAGSADSCSAAEAATVTAVKMSNGPCGRVLPLEAFSWRNRERGWRCSYCPECDRLGQKQRKAARALATA
jgi:hypothetical protein